MLEFSCSSCGKKFKAKESSAGKAARCKCGNQFTIPSPPQEKPFEEPDLGIIPTAPDEDTISLGASPEPSPGSPEADAQANGDWQPMWSRKKFEESIEKPQPTVSWKGIILIILVLVAVPALLLYARHAYNGRLAKIAYRNGLNAITDENYDAAYEQFARCTELRPEWAAAYLPAGFAAFKSDDIDEADSILEKLGRIPGGSRYQSCASNNRAAIAMERKKPEYEDAKAYFEQAVEEDENFIPSNLGMALMHYEKNRAEDAEKYLEKVHNKQSDLSDDGGALYKRMRMRLSFSGGDRRQFLQDYAAAMAKGQDKTFEREAALMALELLINQPAVDREKDAVFINMARRANTPRREEDDYIIVQTAIAELLFSAGMYRECVTELEEIVSPEDEPSDLLYLLANAYAAVVRSELDEAGTDSPGAPQPKKTARPRAMPGIPPLPGMSPMPGIPLISPPSLTETPADGEPGDAEADMVEKTLDLYKKLINNKSFFSKKGKPLLLRAIGFSAVAGRNEEAWAFLEKGLDKFPDSAMLHRMAGALCFRDRKFKTGLEHFETSLKLEPDQKDLGRKVKGYRAKPTFADFRPSRSDDFVVRPLIHVRVKSGTPFPIETESIRLVLDGDPVEFVMGGNECFYLPDKDLFDGEHFIDVYAEDIVGNSATMEFPFPVDLSGPVAELIEPSSATRERKPTIRIELMDEFSTVDAGSVNIVLKSSPGSKDDITLPVLYEGVYRLTDRIHGHKMGDPLEDPEKIVFAVPSPLSPGSYDLVLKVSDVLGNSTKQTLTFTVEAEPEEGEE